jgi:signal transduction histidine kinase
MFDEKTTTQQLLLPNIIPGIIHELNNPLNVLMMNLNILKEDLGDLDQQPISPKLESIIESVDDMELAIDRIENIIKSLGFVAINSNFCDEMGIDLKYLVQYAATLYHTTIKKHFDISIFTPPMKYMFAQVEPGQAIACIIIAIDAIISLEGERNLTVNIEPSGNGTNIDCSFIRKGNDSLLNRDKLTMIGERNSFKYKIIPGGVKFIFNSHEQASV